MHPYRYYENNVYEKRIFMILSTMTEFLAKKLGEKQAIKIISEAGGKRRTADSKGIRNAVQYVGDLFEYMSVCRKIYCRICQWLHCDYGGCF